MKRSMLLSVVLLIAAAGCAGSDEDIMPENTKLTPEQGEQLNQLDAQIAGEESGEGL